VLMGTLMGTLWERARCADVQLLNFQEKMARPNGFEPVCTENLNPDVMVMKSAQDRV
jgi:hypothetical protein